MGDVVGQEVDPHEFPLRIKGRQQGDGKAHAAAQIQVPERLSFPLPGRGSALHQRRKIQPVRHRFSEEPGCVHIVGEVAVVLGGGAHADRATLAAMLAAGYQSPRGR